MTKKKSKLQSKIKKKLRKNRLFHLTQVMMIHLQKRNHKKKIFLQRDQELHQMLVVKVIPAAQKLKKQMKRKLPSNIPKKSASGATQTKKLTNSSSSSKGKDVLAQSSDKSSSSSKDKDALVKTTSSSDAVGRYQLTDDEVPTHSDGTKNQLKLAQSVSHLLTHYPKNPDCEACQ
jgi:hypothetical protein